MNKLMLCAGLLSAISITGYADEPTQPAPAAPAVNTGVQPAPAPATPATPAVSAPAPMPAATNAPTPTPVTAVPAAKPAAPINNTVQPNAAPKPDTPAAPQNMPIDCNYKIPSSQTKIDTDVITKWAQKAAEQSFDYDYSKIDQQLTTLKSCYTDQGWQSFYDALQKSGNLTAIKTQKLMVNSMVQGDVTVSVIKDNQWKISMPIQVVYQNDKEKLQQQLTINLVVGRKINGDLGIMQMVAMPRQAAAPAAAPTAAEPAKPAETEKPAQ